MKTPSAFLCDKLKLLTLLVAIPSFASWFGDLHHWLELASHFRVHYAAAFGLLLGLLVCFRQWRWSAFAAAALAANAAPIIPWMWADASPKETSPTPRVRILLSNVYTANTDSRPLLDLIESEKPDIIVLEEINARWLASLQPVSATYPHFKTEVLEDNFGIGVWSRWPLRNARVIASGPFNVPTILANLEPPGLQVVSLIATHPVPPVTKESAGARDQQLGELAALARQSISPIILIGDLNVTMWSPQYARFEQQSGLKNARKGFGVLPSWPAPYTWIGIPLDHCLVHPSLKVRAIRLGPQIGSDHLPVLIDLAVRPSE